MGRLCPRKPHDSRWKQLSIELARRPNPAFLSEVSREVASAAKEHKADLVVIGRGGDPGAAVGAMHMQSYASPLAPFYVSNRATTHPLLRSRRRSFSTISVI